MNPEAILLCYEKPTSCDVRLRSLAEFLGAPCRTLDTRQLQAECDRIPNHLLCVLASAGTISHWRRKDANHVTFLDRLCQKTRLLFIYGFSPENDSVSLANDLTNGQVSDVRRFERADLEYEAAASYPQLTKEFSSLRFGPIQSHIDFAFAYSATRGALHPLISIAGLPFWVLSEKAGCTVFLLACTEIADVRETITEDHLDISRYFSRLVPAAMFLKWAFKGRCWHSEHRFANFIIDDPLLKESYGHLNYQHLLHKMDESNFATTIAFIPWNYRRTQNQTAQLFRDRPDRLSLCIHGCNHTSGEFATRDLAAINQSVQLASQRMNAHRAHTGLEHDPVMVFPQGRFSPEALRALQCNNYLAAINSRAKPTSPEKACVLSLGDLLEPAVTRYGGVPLYLRRYPGSLEQFAFDLFFSRPLLVVEHHTYLKDGGSRLSEFIARLNSLGTLEWRGLGEIVQNTYLERYASTQTNVCKLYANSQVIENRSDRDRTFVVTKSQADDVPIENIFINGRITDSTIAGDTVQFQVELPAHASAKVNILYKNLLPNAGPQYGLGTATRIWTRRMLSEFRDNVLCKSDFLMATAQAVNHRFLRERLKSLSDKHTAHEEPI